MSGWESEGRCGRGWAFDGWNLIYGNLSFPPPAETEYMVMQQGITAGTVLAILLPVLIAMICYASYTRNKKKEINEYRHSVVRNSGKRFISAPFHNSSRTPSPQNSSSIITSVKGSGETTPLGSEAPPPVPPRRVTEYPLGHSDSSGGSYDGSTTFPSSDSGKHSMAYSANGKKSRHSRRASSKFPEKYDGEYYTNEPVNDKPVIFQNVLWDLGDNPGKQSAV